jgi:glyoxylase-like metal-dependent hydrolase (beta-lactamase superfamily II)
MQKTIRIRILAAAAFIGCATLAYTQAPQQPSKLDTVKLADNMYAIHNDFVPGNTTVLITNEGVLLVDDKFDVDGPNVVAAVKKLTSQPIKYVVSTHYHGDHSGSNALMQKLGAQVVSSQAARKRMVDGKQPGQANLTIEQKGHIYLGGQTVDLYYFGRAHTDGDIVALFPAQRVLAAGDMFAFGDATPELIDYAGGGSAKAWTTTLDAALKLDFNTVVPGHGVVTTKAEMANFRTATFSLQNKVHSMLVAKKSKAEVEAMLRKDFHYADVHVMFSLDGLMQEMK